MTRIIMRLGWRNLWRRPRRSLITIFTVGTAYALLIALIGLTEGLSRQMLQNGTALLLGHLQIHHSQYLPDRSLYDTLGSRSSADVDSLLSRLENYAGVRAASPRLFGFGLASTGEQSAGVQLIGIEPDAEMRTSRLIHGMANGQGLHPPGGRSILLGDILGQQLNAEIGSEIAIVTQAADGSLGNNLFRVSGILHTGLSYLDRSLGILQLTDLQDLLVLEPGQIHEIVLTIDEAMAADGFAAGLNRSGILPPDAIAQSWGELAPQLKDYVGMAEGMNSFIIFLVALFAGFGVLNTMMMAVFERTREIGLIGSMGMPSNWILRSIIMESILLAALGLAGGLMVGACLMLYLTVYGWDLSRWMGELSMIGVRMDPVLRAAWAWDQVFWSAVGLMLAAFLAAYLPARRAARMDPVEALHAPTEG